MKKNREKESNKPVETVRYGTISASIWRNETDNGTWFNVTFSRSYNDGKEWKHTDSFGRDDLLTLAKVANEAHTRIYQLLSEEDDDE
jgi:hypothetical protein